MPNKEKHYHIITIGCQMNKNDSERIASYLEGLGYVQTSNQGEIDVVVVTTCGVRQSAEDRIYGLVPNIRAKNKDVKIVLTGCLSGRPDVQKRLERDVDVWLPITELPKLGEKLGLEKTEENSLSGYFKVQPKYDSTFSALVPIGNGCNNFCTYCVVPYARGRETYRPAEDVIAEVKELIKRGYKEITLIAQNVNSYKSPSPSQGAGRGEVNFAQLLKVVNDLPGDFWLRFATSHPKDMSDELIETMAACDKLCRHIHLPVQAGDNGVLARMNRKYTREQYIELINKIRKALDFKLEIPNPKQIQNSKLKIKNSWQPPVAISTDTIVGFPGETGEQFSRTADLFREVRFDMAYLAQYSPRPGTAAGKMEDDVSREEKKRREEYLNDILSGTALANNQAYLDKEVEVLFDEKKGKKQMGKTKTAKTVRVETAENLIGQIRKVKIVSVQDFGMIGKIYE